MKEEQVKETTLTYRLDTKQSSVSYATGCVSVSVTSCSDWSTNDPFVSLYEWSKWWKVSPGILGHVVLIWRDTCHRLLRQWGVKQNTLQTQVQAIGLIAVVSCDVSEQDRRSCYQLSKCPAFLKVYGFEGNNDWWLMKLWCFLYASLNIFLLFLYHLLALFPSLHHCHFDKLQSIDFT